jgi:predicted O-methyltransferase YrrM
VAPLKTKRFCLLEFGEPEILFDIPRILGQGGEYLNLGHGAGGSAMLLAAGLLDQDLDGMVHSVDRFKERDGDHNRNLKEAAKARLVEVGLADKVQLYRGLTSRYFGTFSNLTFVFIDAGHGYEDVRDDFVNYGPCVKVGGAVAFHDTNQEPSHRVIQEEVLTGPWKQIEHVNRIKVFQRV